MRTGTIAAWIFVGLGLLMIGTLLYMFEVTEARNLGRVLVAVGLVYFVIGLVLLLKHDRHMAKHMRGMQE